MKRFFIGLLAISTLALFNACENSDTDPNEGYGILPENFKVDIPSAISHEAFKSTTNDTLQGAEIYEHLKFFIAVGESAGTLVEEIMFAIKAYKIENVTDLTYLSDDDNRMKHLTVVSDVEFKNRTWEYKLTITDSDSESNEDGGIAMQVFWNNNPIEGIALLKPYNIDRLKDSDAREAIFSIEYSAAGNEQYDEIMQVEIAGVPLPDATTDPYGLQSMKMFVGKKGELVDVYGNSNHPNAQFNYSDAEALGFNWAFVASGHETKNIGVAEVGLPASDSEEFLREAILVENSIKNVLTREITNSILSENPELEGMEALIAVYLTPYLKNTEAPGFFDKTGFVQAQTAPNSDYTELETRIKNLTPFVPAEVSNLVVSFQ